MPVAPVRRAPWSLWIEWGFVAAIIAYLVYSYIFFRQAHYLPLPFFPDPNDVYADGFSSAWWACSDLSATRVPLSGWGALGAVPPMIAAGGAAVSRGTGQRPAAVRAYIAITPSMARRHTAQKPTSSRVNMMQSA